jgi:hypothetical protein
MKTTIVAITTGLLFAVTTAGWCVAADAPPGSPADPKTSLPAVSPPPPDTVPSPRDPGIVKKPDVADPPGSVVTPPIVDPKMAVDPEQPPVNETNPTQKGPAPRPPVPSQ